MIFTKLGDYDNSNMVRKLNRKSQFKKKIAKGK
jgi:hypothetical protein